MFHDLSRRIRNASLLAFAALVTVVSGLTAEDTVEDGPRASLAAPMPVFSLAVAFAPGSVGVQVSDCIPQYGECDEEILETVEAGLLYAGTLAGLAVCGTGNPILCVGAIALHEASDIALVLAISNLGECLGGDEDPCEYVECPVE